MKLPNRITVARVLIPLVFIPALMGDWPYGRLIALMLFLFGVASDWLDGYLARRYHCTSNFGRLMDPLADKVLVVSALICLAVRDPQYVKAWMVVIIVAREFLVTGLRLIALQANIVLSAEGIGKHKTAWQMIAITSLLAFHAFNDLRNFLPKTLYQWVDYALPPALMGVFYLATALTLISGALYFWRHRNIVMTNV
ncbi:MAG: CDP-diacylglycerol--glycerol-3-phosphate 3-phosphatidyltransferase [bacterium]|nr:CDP-diacylglycerol--glycerol-3-phosphate 3-phosphatidyltransferase [bacterium]